MKRIDVQLWIYKSLLITAKVIISQKQIKNSRRSKLTLMLEKLNKFLVEILKKVLLRATKKEAMQYTGERKLVGIAMMHKSNPASICR